MESRSGGCMVWEVSAIETSLFTSLYESLRDFNRKKAIQDKLSLPAKDLMARLSISSRGLTRPMELSCVGQVKFDCNVKGS